MVLRKTEQLWHEHYIPSFFAALIVAIIAAFFELTTASIVLVASVGASAFILTHTKSQHLTKLNTTIKAYIIAIILSLAMHYIRVLVNLSLSISIFILLFMISVTLYILNAVHPPAVSASLSFILLGSETSSLIYLFLAIIILLIAVRFTTYIFTEGLPIKQFFFEFKKQLTKDEKQVVRTEKEIVKEISKKKK